jgi:hypothetical protein
VALGVALLLAALAHYNYVVLCLLFGLLWFAIELAVSFRSARFDFARRTWRPLCAGAVTFLLGFSPLLWMLVGWPGQMPVSRGFDHLEQYSADALGFLVPSWNHLLFGRFARQWNPHIFVAGFEGTVYIGVVVLALAGLGFWKGRSLSRPWANRALVLGLTFYFLSLGPKIRLLGHPLSFPGPAALLYRVPFAPFVSAPARFHAGVALSVAILSSLGFQFVLDKVSKRSGRCFLIVGLGILVMGDYLTVPFPRSSVADPAAPASSGWSSRQVAQSCVLPLGAQYGTVLTFRLVRAPYSMKSMWMQIRDGGRFALVDGYLSYAPPYIWKNFWTTPILRSLLALEGALRTPIDVASDRTSAPATIRDLHLSAIVVFDSPERDAGVTYVERVAGIEGERAGSCTVFPVGANGRADAAPRR